MNIHRVEGSGEHGWAKERQSWHGRMDEGGKDVGGKESVTAELELDRLMTSPLTMNSGQVQKGLE